MDDTDTHLSILVGLHGLYAVAAWSLILIFMDDFYQATWLSAFHSPFAFIPYHHCFDTK